MDKLKEKIREKAYKKIEYTIDLINYIDTLKYTSRNLVNMLMEADDETMDFFNEGYPFQNSFDELTEDIEKWHELVLKKIEKNLEE